MMDLFLLFIRFILAALFVTAGAAKLADPKGAEKAARGFGVSGISARFGPVVLSATEIVIGGLLVFPATSWIGAIGAAILLVAFVVMMAYQHAKGNAPDCHCFGQLHSEPVGIKSIVRNVIFLAPALLLLYRGPNVQGLALQQITTEMVPTILGGLSVIMLAGALLYLRKIIDTQKGLARRLDVLEVLSHEGVSIDHEHVSDPHQGLPIGAPLPGFEMLTVDGGPIGLEALLGFGRSILFFFVDPKCEPCQAMLPDIIKWREQLSSRASFVFVSSGSEKENREKFDGLDGAPVLLDEGRSFAISVGGRWTPTALLIDTEGKIASHIAAGDHSIAELIEKMKLADLGEPFTYFTNGHHHGRGLKIGSEAPEFALPDLQGKEIRKQDLIGKPTLVAFWSPTCPHCGKMLEELKLWERERKNGDANLIVFSDGDPDEHRALGLSSPIVLDEGYQVAAKLGMFGTPSAVLVNESGVIATETAVGAPNIWALIGKNK